MSVTRIATVLDLSELRSGSPTIYKLVAGCFVKNIPVGMSDIDALFDHLRTEPVERLHPELAQCREALLEVGG